MVFIFRFLASGSVVTDSWLLGLELILVTDQDGHRCSSGVVGFCAEGTNDNNLAFQQRGVRSAAVLSRSGTDQPRLPEGSDIQPLADVLRLRTANVTKI
jgi:hypothetical protein